MSNNKCEAGTPNCNGKIIHIDYGNSAKDTTHEEIYACTLCGIQIKREENFYPRSSESLGTVIGKKDAFNKISKLKTNTRQNLSQHSSKEFTNILNLDLMIDRHLKGVIPGFNSSTLVDDTKSLYLLATKQIPNLNSKNLLAVCAYHTLKKYERPKQLVEICQVINPPDTSKNRSYALAEIKKIERSANRLYNKLKKEEIITEANPTNPLNFVRNKIYQVAKGTKEIKIYQKSKDNLKKMQDAELTASKNPAGIAAALVYTSMIILDLHVKQSQIARIFGVSDLCVRKNSKELFSLLERNSG